MPIQGGTPRWLSLPVPTVWRSRDRTRSGTPIQAKITGRLGRASKQTLGRLLAHGGIIFYTYPGEAVPHHVVIDLGGDKILQAPETGQNVGYGTLSEFPGQTAAVRRITDP